MLESPRREGNKEVMRSPRCLGFRVRGKGLRVRREGNKEAMSEEPQVFRVWGLGVRVWGLGFWGLGSGAWFEML
jgi:hypothetical protein